MKKYHIVVAEDEKHTRRALLIILRKAGYIATVIEDGQKALQEILDHIKVSEKIDLLITDIQMPKLSGVDLIRELAKQNIDIPVLIITGYGDEEEYANAVRAGCMECIEKPFEPHELLDSVAYVLEKSSRLQAIKQAI